MARGPRKKSSSKTKAEPASTVQSFNTDDFRRSMSEAHRLQKEASEYSGDVGRITKTFCEKSGMTPKVFTSLRGLDRMDPAKRLSFYRDFFLGAHALGHFDQIDAFDDIANTLQTILDDISRNSNAKADPAQSEDGVVSEEDSDVLERVLN